MVDEAGHGQEASGVPRFERRLGDGVVGKVVGEVRSVHWRAGWSAATRRGRPDVPRGWIVLAG